MKNEKTKKILFFIGLGLDVAIIISLFVIALIMIITMPQKTGLSESAWKEAAYENGPFIGYLQTHSTFYFWVFVFPLIALFIANIAFLVLYIRKQTKKDEPSVDNLSEEQKAALRAELLKELQGEQQPEQKAEEPEAPKEEK